MATAWLSLLLMFIGCVFGDKEKIIYIKCLKTAIQGFNGPGKVILPPYVIPNLPLCITTVGFAGDCNQGEYQGILQHSGHWRRMNAFFSCINAYNAGKNVQTNQQSIFLWTGTLGKQEAETQAVFSQAWTVPDPDSGPAFWADSQIDALGIAFQIAHGAPFGGRAYQMILQLLMSWFIFNRDASIPVNMYSSIDFDFGRTPNPNKAALIRDGITKAIIVNSYFWRVEIPAVMRSAILHNTEPTVLINMRKYDGNGQPLKAPSEWESPVNLFGESASNIPIILKPLDRNDHTMQSIIIEGAKVTTLGELIGAYRKAGGHLMVPIRMDYIQWMMEFIVWTATNFKVVPPPIKAKLAKYVGYADSYAEIEEDIAKLTDELDIDDELYHELELRKRSKRMKSKLIKYHRHH